MEDCKLRKGERLKSRKLIKQLFEKGNVIQKWPIRIIFTPVEAQQYPLKVAISVPKRKFKRAVDRNLLKRRMREGYRLNKSILYHHLFDKDRYYAMMFLYYGNEIVEFAKIEKSIIHVLQNFSKLDNRLL